MAKGKKSREIKDKIELIVLNNEIYEQEQIVTMLAELGIETNQPAVSKYLTQLQLIKGKDGYYIQSEDKILENKKQLLLNLVTVEADYIKKYTLTKGTTLSGDEENKESITKNRKKASNLYAVAIKVRNGYETSIADLVVSCFYKSILGVTTGRLCVFIYTTSEDRSKEIFRFLKQNRPRKKEQGEDNIN